MLGNELRERRQERGLSQSKLADITGIQQAKLSAFELQKQELSDSELVVIEKALDSLNDQKLAELKEKIHQPHKRWFRFVFSPEKRLRLTSRNAEYLASLHELESEFRSKENNLRAVSFFAGCGGLCYGIEAAGFDIVATNELEESYKDIYRLNFPSAEFLPNDITEISDADIEQLCSKFESIDLMIGGPPCQGFSLAGKRDVNDSRNTLFENYLHIAELTQPTVILMENVRLLTSMKDPNGEFVSKRILERFKSIGYESSFFEVNAKDYGVPQHRERVIFIGIKSELNIKPSIPKPLCGDAQVCFQRPFLLLLLVMQYPI